MSTLVAAPAAVDAANKCSEQSIQRRRNFIWDGRRCSVHVPPFNTYKYFYRMQNCKAHRLVSTENFCGSRWRIWEGQRKIPPAVSAPTPAPMPHALNLCCVIWKSLNRAMLDENLLSRCAHLSSKPTKSLPFCISDEIAMRLDGHSSRKVANAHTHRSNKQIALRSHQMN